MKSYRCNTDLCNGKESALLVAYNDMSQASSALKATGSTLTNVQYDHLTNFFVCSFRLGCYNDKCNAESWLVLTGI